MYATLENVLHVIKIALRVHEGNKLQRPIDGSVQKEVHNLIKDTHDKALSGKCVELYQTFEQATARTVYTGRASDQIRNKNRKLAETEGFTRHVIHQLIQSTTFFAPLTRPVKQHVKIAVAKQANFR